MTHVERLARPSFQGDASGLNKSRRSIIFLLIAATTFAVVVTIPRGAGAATIAQDKARAADLYSQIQRVTAQLQYLGQTADLANIRLARIKSTIANTKTIVAQIEGHVANDNTQLKSDAIFAYVNNGATASSSPLFSTNANTVGATDVYNQLAEGNIGVVIASLKTNKVELTQERAMLTAEQAQAQDAVNAAAAALSQANALRATIETARSQVEGQISSYYNAIAAAAAAASQRAAVAAATAVSHSSTTSSAQTTSPQTTSIAAPAPSTLGEAAVRVAETFLGPPAVWYVWGGASRSGVDCSGLVMLAYAAVGVSLPHYSGGQFADTERVPLWDIQPGDLLFYGYNGDEHVSMYVGGGNMIEAPETGYQVHITPIRLGYGFVGIGRVRA